MSSTQNSDTTKMKGILTDVTKCIGCQRCVEGCVRKNKLPRDFFAYFKAKDGLSGNRFTSIVKTEGKKPGSVSNIRRQCMHCLDPGCQAACLVGALTKRPDGAVEYDESKCIGCRYCMLSCPFSIPRYDYDQPLPYIRKCKMNEECRVKGGMPACVSICPTGATVFGTRDDLIKEAKRRIKENPDLYIDHVYGEYEFGGTSVIYISDVPVGDVLKMPSKEEFEKLRLPQLATESIPSMVNTWVWVTPFQFLTVSAGLTGVWFLKKRKERLEEKIKNKEPMSKGKEGENE
jgi:formate dehydrogenase iron-sulfur subunit